MVKKGYNVVISSIPTGGKNVDPAKVTDKVFAALPSTSEGTVSLNRAKANERWKMIVAQLQNDVNTVTIEDKDVTRADNAQATYATAISFDVYFEHGVRVFTYNDENDPTDQALIGEQSSHDTLPADSTGADTSTAETAVARCVARALLASKTFDLEWFNPVEVTNKSVSSTDKPIYGWQEDKQEIDAAFASLTAAMANISVTAL